MAEVTTHPQAKTPSIPKLIGVLVVMILIVVLGWLFLGNALDSGDDNGKPPASHGQDTSTPDRAKQQSGDNGDTTPSPNGGQSNSLQSQ
jgi:hypothetical protein